MINQTRPVEILLVEDDAGHAALIEMNLRDAGLNNPLKHVADGQAALDYLATTVGTSRTVGLLVLLDLNLPVIDGFNVLAKLKAGVQTKSVPVVVLTSTDNQQEIDRCYELGCNVYLRKPIEYADFVEAMKRLGSFISVIEMPGARGRYSAV